MKLYDSKKMRILAFILNGKISLIDDFDMNEVRTLNERIIIKPSQIRKMLLKYLAGEISDFELNRWARFICQRTEYKVPGGDDDNINDFYEAMYYVIQRLSTPEIDGDIDENRIQLYLDELDAKYPMDPPEELCL